VSQLTQTAYKEAVSQFATGVTVITAEDGDGPVGMTANAVCSLSLDPLLLLVCFDRGSRTLETVQRSKRFGVSVLAESQREVSDHFASKQDSFGSVPYRRVERVPVVEGAVASIVCHLDQWIEGGDHLIGIGSVISVSSESNDPLIWFDGSYRSIGKKLDRA